MGHVTLTMTTPLFGVVCHPQVGLDIVYLCAKFDFDDSSFSRSIDMIGAPQI